MVLLAAGCTSDEEQPGQAEAAPTTTIPPLRLELTAKAKGPESDFDAGKALKGAEPGLKKFLTGYLKAAFTEAAKASDKDKPSWDKLLGMFDERTRKAARKDVAALSLGEAAGKVQSVRPQRATAKALVLFDGGERPRGATVTLRFDGSAEMAEGAGPLRLRATLYLLRSDGHWRIAAYQSSTGGQS